MKTYSRNFLIKLYKEMLRIRLCEESFVKPIVQGEVKCPVHLYSGQEAIAVGVCANLTQRDYIFGTHRSHGHYLAKGGNMNQLVAEVYGKESGCSRGRGGSMHLCAPEIGILGSAPIVAGTISLALGSALASKIKKDRNVTVSFFGDGAAGEGVLYEALNFASLKKLPILFVCENNFYSTHLSIRECRPSNNIYKTGQIFCIPSYRVDGNDVLKVYGAAKKAVELCRRDKGPVFIEFITYRLRGHVGPDDNIQGQHIDIRPAGEIAKWKKRDPIKKLERFIYKNNILKTGQMESIRKMINQEIKNAYSFAEKSLYPKKSELTRHVFKR